MALTRLAKISSIEEQIQQLENQRKELLAAQKEQDQKARTKRLIERGAILESFISDASAFTNADVKAFLEKTVATSFALKILDGMRSEAIAQTVENGADTPKAAG